MEVRGCVACDLYQWETIFMRMINTETAAFWKLIKILLKFFECQYVWHCSVFVN